MKYRLPYYIQWAPPGLQWLRPRDFETELLSLTVREDWVPRLNSALRGMRLAAEDGLYAPPYGDFSHASEWGGEFLLAFTPIEFRWCGSHVEWGGIRLKVEWNREVYDRIVTGVALGYYKYFSPRMLIGGERPNYTFEGIQSNVGGLCQTPAFEKIQAIQLEEASEAPGAPA